MVRRVFEDELGNKWIIAKLGSTLMVEGERNGLTLQEIAKSCARKLGITETKSGVPLKYVNQHRRIWNLIWEKGRPV